MTGFGLFALSSKPLLAYAFRWIRGIHTHRCQGDSTKKTTNTGQAIISARSTIHICKYFNIASSAGARVLRQLQPQPTGQVHPIDGARTSKKHEGSGPIENYCASRGPCVRSCVFMEECGSWEPAGNGSVLWRRRRHGPWDFPVGIAMGIRPQGIAPNRQARRLF